MWPTLASATKKLWWTTRTQCVPWCMRWEAAERFFDGSTSILDVIFVAQEWHKEVKWATHDEDQQRTGSRPLTEGDRSALGVSQPAAGCGEAVW